MNATFNTDYAQCLFALHNSRERKALSARRNAAMSIQQTPAVKNAPIASFTAFEHHI